MDFSSVFMEAGKRWLMEIALELIARAKVPLS